MHIDIDIDANIRLILILAWIANVVAGACAGSGKRAAIQGGLLGAFMGPLGVVAATWLRLHLASRLYFRLIGH